MTRMTYDLTSAYEFTRLNTDVRLELNGHKWMELPYVIQKTDSAQVSVHRHVVSGVEPPLPSPCKLLLLCAWGTFDLQKALDELTGKPSSRGRFSSPLTAELTERNLVRVFHVTFL